MRLFLSTLVLAAAPALAQDARDDAIFGIPATETPPAANAASAAPKTIADTLQVGGRLELAASTGQTEHQKLPSAGFAQKKDVDLFLDARPNKDLRALVRVRFSEETPVNPAVQAARAAGDCAECVATKLDEAWFKWDYRDALFMTYGKQHLKWGSGRFWNPTDFTAVESKDPFAVTDRRLGRELLKLHFPVEKQGFNYYAILEMADAERNEDMGYALRGEFAFGGVGEAAFTWEHRPHRPNHVGADVSAGVGPFDVNVETAATRGDDRVQYTGDVDPATGRLPAATAADEKRTFLQTVAGLQYSYKYNDDDSVTAGAEVFQNGLGYEDRELELYSVIKGDAQPLYAGRRYAGAFVRLPNPGSWNDSTFYVSGLRNLSDGTAVARLTGVYALFKEASVEAFASRCFGDYGEFCFRIPESYQTLATGPAAPALTPIDRATLLALPTRRTLYTGGVAVSMSF